MWLSFLTNGRLALSKENDFRVSVLTRDNTSPGSEALLLEYPNIKLIQGSYTTEEGLRTAFASQDVVYFNIDSFNVGEPFEYFWTFRAYEIAVQSGVKWFIYAGTPTDRFSSHGLAEEYRNSHNVVSARLTGWLTAQPLDRLPWSIITGGVYAEMLNLLLRPVPNGDGYAFMLPLGHESVMPLVPLDNYGEAVKWALKHPQESIGKFVSASPFQLTFHQVAEALEKFTGKKAEFQPVTVDEWMQGVSKYIDPEGRLPRGASSEDATTFTFRKSFGAWWSIWRDNRIPSTKDVSQWADTPQLSKYETLQDWMLAVKYEPSKFSMNLKER
jgi:nucleoside-diphosphate-sugar epimerase